MEQLQSTTLPTLDDWYDAMNDSKEADTAQERQEAFCRVLEIERAWKIST